MTCAALFAMFGLTLAGVDRGKVYEIPAAQVATATAATIAAAKVCAWRHGIHWKIVK